MEKLDPGAIRSTIWNGLETFSVCCPPSVQEISIEMLIVEGYWPETK